MLARMHIPIKYKFLGVILFIMFFSLGVFFYFAYTTFAEDKKLFVMDLNMTSLKATISEIKLDLKSRLEVLQVFVPRIYNPLASGDSSAPDDPYLGLPESLKDEILAVTFLRQDKENGRRFNVIRQYKNSPLLVKRGLDDNALKVINDKHPLPLDGFLGADTTELLNRSVGFSTSKGNVELALLTFLVSGQFLNDDESKDVIIVVDIVQDFLRKKL